MLYEKQTWLNGKANNTPLNAARLNHMESGIDAISKRGFYSPVDKMVGTVHPEVPTYTTGIAADGAFNEAYQISGGALPAIWPIDVYGDLGIFSNTQTSRSSVGVGTVSTYRFMSDGSEISWFTDAGFEIDLFIDGQPIAANPLLMNASSGLGALGISKLVFPSARPRLIEMRTIAGLVGIYAKKPYRIWKPPADPNPKVAVVGDSWVLPSTLSNTIAAAFTPDPYLRGLYQRMAAPLGISRLVTDGIGGSGYIAAGSPARPYGHADRLSWLDRIDPDVIVVHGGGGNDMMDGSSVSAVISAAVAYFTTLRAQHTDAKLVFVEGFAPPGFFPDVINPLYTDVREGVQAEINDAYFIDVATSRPPINGTGFVTATNTTGNSDIYIGSDSFHYTGAGAAMARAFLVPKLRRVLADNGALVGSLI